MEIGLLYFQGRVREVLRAVGDATTPVICRAAGDADKAERLGFRGSPTILVSGLDRLAGPGDPVGLACRLYPRADGGDHSRTVCQIRAVRAYAA